MRFRPMTKQVKTFNYRNKVRDLIKDALQKNKRITIISTDRSNVLNCDQFTDNLYYNSHLKYENAYDRRINNIYEELSTEIFSDIEAQVYDYPEKFIRIVTSDKNNTNTNMINSYLIYSPE